MLRRTKSVQPARQGPPHQPGRHHPHDDPFFDGAGPLGLDWALGLRQSIPGFTTNRTALADRRLGGNGLLAAKESGPGRGRRHYGAQQRGTCAAPCTSPLYFYPHNAASRPLPAVLSITARSIPAPTRAALSSPTTPELDPRLTFDANGGRSMVSSTRAGRWSLRRPVRRHCLPDEGPDGALYYVDLAIQTSAAPSRRQIRRIRYIQSTWRAGVCGRQSNRRAQSLTVAFSSRRLG